MEDILNRDLRDMVAVNLNERELFLIKWSLESMAHSNPKTGILRCDIDNLRSKLVTKCVRNDTTQN